MSSLKEQVEADISRFLENIETQTRNDQIQTLRDLLSKYIHLSTCDYKMTSKDFSDIQGDAKGRFARDTFPVYLGPNDMKVPPSQLPNLCLIEATVAFLNKNDCLKKLPKFDKKK